MLLRALALAVLSSAVLPQHPATVRAEPRPWEHETSDVPANPRIRFGHLENGLRYAWIANPEPDQRCYLRLHVDAGSMAETEEERGMAHFLEHMLFNGTRNFPGTTLIEWFQEQGMEFGADTNASTSWSETVYEIDLPTSERERVAEGLRVLRDFADGALLAPEEIEAEKGVVDAEERERDSARLRVFERTMDALLEGTLPPRRLPIGTREARADFDRESITGFYRRWYRPELMTLVVAGDLGELDPAPLVREIFGDLRPPESAPPREPAVGEPTKDRLFFAVHDPEVPEVLLTLSRLVPYEDEPYDRELFDEEVPLEYARQMLNLRFSELSKEADAPFISAHASAGGLGLRVFEGEELTVRCTPETWREALAFCEQELRRALQYGFHDAELEELRANALRSLDEQVERERTRSSAAYVGELLRAAEIRTVPTSATTDRELLRPRIEALTPKRCQEALAAAWSEGTLSLRAIGGLDLDDEAPRTLKEALEASREVEVEAPEDIEVAEFAYASSPEETGEVVAREHLEDLDVHQVRFANGVRLNVKVTDFEEKQILLRAVVGQGALTLPVERRALAHVADSVLLAGGFGAHTIEEVRRLTAGREVGWGFDVATDAFQASGATTAEDLLLQCELFCAFQDLGWRDGGLVRYRRSLPDWFETLRHTPAGPLQMDYLVKLHGGDERWGLVEREALESVEMEHLKAWLAPHLEKAPIEIAIVGDLDVEETIAAAARTFGTLPERGAPMDTSERRKSPPLVPGLREEYTIETETPAALLYLSFPAPDGFDLERRRHLDFLVTVLRDRLRVGLREELGASYSPSAWGGFSEIYPGVGEIAIQVQCDPSQVKAVAEAALGVAEELAEEGVDRAELERLREPARARMRDARRLNGYWLHYLAECQTRPEVLDELRSDLSHLDELDPERLSKLAARHLREDRASIAVVRPESATGGAPREAASEGDEEL